LYDKDESIAITNLVFKHYLGLNAIETNLKRDSRISESEMLLFHFALKRLIKGEPVQYVLEDAYFYGLQLKVRSGVLIPRPETEELVALIIEEYADSLAILEVGTGSGCISLALKKHLNKAQIVAIDCSEEALEIAQENQKELGLEIDFRKHNFLDEQADAALAFQKWDLIVSNPPYIPVNQKDQMHINVLEFEPHLALFVEDADPLIFYRRIAEFGQKMLKDNGKIAVEISDSLGQETQHLFVSYGYRNVRVLNDINKNQRIVTCEK
jgi:release factor glutamine methyltransferase